MDNKKNIPVHVQNRVAWSDWADFIICGNSDYTITFTFDEEWGEDTAKTAIFKYRTAEGMKHTKQPFIGNTVAVPELRNIREVEVGVRFGDIATTTGATIRCAPSVLCDSGEESEYEKERFDKLMQLFNDKLHGHENKDTLDKLTAKMLQLLEKGAMVESVKVLTDEETGDTTLRLKLLRQELDPEEPEFIYLPVFGVGSAYDEETDSFGLGLDIGLTQYRPMPQVESNTDEQGYARLYPNVFYTFGAVDNLYIYLMSGETADTVQSYHFSFIANDKTIFIIGADIVWGGDNEIVIEGGKRYEVSIVNNVALWTSAAVPEAVSAE